MDAWLDAGVEELVEKLRAHDVLENTLLVFLIDNGWANGCVSKGWALDKGLRTPVIFSWPAGLAPAARGARASELVSPVDLYATILDLAGAGVPEHCVGRSLRPVLEGGALAPREALFGALYPLQPAEVRADPARDAYGLWARTPRWKYILALKDLFAAADAGSSVGEREDIKVILAPDFVRRRGEVELYDLDADPHERVNLAGRPEHAAIEAELRAATLAWWRASGGGPLDLP
jgi:uncharacterized sulfatase